MAASLAHMSNQDLKEIVVKDREGVSESELREALKTSPSPVNLLGTWVNVDANTTGLVRVVLGWAAGLMVHPYGACHPNPCDWGSVRGMPYGNSVSSSYAVAFSAVFQPSFKTTILTGYIQAGMLVVETFSHFTDGSGRFDYYSRETFRR